jgi:hypothetical protein
MHEAARDRLEQHGDAARKLLATARSGMSSHCTIDEAVERRGVDAKRHSRERATSAPR